MISTAMVRRLRQAFSAEVRRVRRPTVESLVRADFVVEPEVLAQPQTLVPQALVRVKANVFVLDAALRPFDEDDVDPPSLTVHAHSHALFEQARG